MIPDNVITLIPRYGYLLILINDYCADKLIFMLLETTNNTCVEYRQFSYKDVDPDDPHADTLWSLLGWQPPGGTEKK